MPQIRDMMPDFGSCAVHRRIAFSVMNLAPVDDEEDLKSPDSLRRYVCP